ncbi:hypothetical protein M404DRAFT_1002140 [Pisolithus tinctorius Marx 270]|uniref:Uncharacterized protein n=1 Tax=Pisolithus tinctorius Marx 270 TaxID=870435 RepID=A0A0C3J0B0_PISTI|nr:hypothetical protein M404DRAFT_1002140 [Pisolithus tinctorius Marx 270]
MQPTVTAASVKAPPAAHTTKKDVIFLQPSRTSMSTSAPRVPASEEEHPNPQSEQQSEVREPLRLRGGCLPCPWGWCFIIPCPCI